MSMGLQPATPSPLVGGAARPAAARVVRALMEGLVLLLVCLAPWAFGAAEPSGEFCLYAGIAALLGLWAARLLLEGRVHWHRAGVALCLAGVFLIGVVQVLPLSPRALAWLSPSTARLYAELLPAEREQVGPGEPPPPEASRPGRTISLYPGATRAELVRLLAVAVLFLAVRNNCAGAAPLRRLALALLLNGALLSVFAFAELVSSKPGTLYWKFPVLNRPFGPFICRNHFPFYISMCFGLGGAFLWANRGASAEAKAHSRSHDSARPGQPALPWRYQIGALLQDPFALWVGLGLALMLAAVVGSLSRGGVIGLLVAAVVCFALRAGRPGRGWRLGLGLYVGVGALAILAWFGLAPVQARLATVWSGEALEEGRGLLWYDMLAAVRQFPLWGAGYGTFPYLEPMFRRAPERAAEVWEHAHNDYLEALVEGGPLCLLLALVGLALVYRGGWRALNHRRGRPEGALALGALFGVTAVAAHSFVDYGLHIPAVAALFAVLCAHLSALGETGAEGETTVATFRLAGLAPVAGAALAVALGAVLAAEGWRLTRAEALEYQAYLLDGQTAPEQRERWLALLDAAAELAPDSAAAQMEAAQAHLYVSDEQRARRGRAEAAGAAACALIDVGPSAAPSLATSAGRAAVARLAPGPAEAPPGADPHRVLALRRYLRARDLCPLLAKAQMRLAAEADWLERADPPEAYRRRAKRLRPLEPELWYVAGLQELAEGKEREAWASWRRALGLSPRYLPGTLTYAGKRLDAAGLIDHVLPEDAGLLVRAGELLYPGDRGRQRPLREKALALLDASAPTPEAGFLRGQLRAELGDARAALADCRAAVARRPREVAWRFELAVLLRQQGDLRESRHELLLVLAQQPGHPEALRLLDAVLRDLARQEVGRAGPPAERK